MNIESCFEFGKIWKPHGIKGELSVAVTAQDPGAYQKLDTVFVEVNSKLIPFVVEKISLNKEKAIVKFEDVNREEDGEVLLGCKIYLPLTALPGLRSGQFYYHEIKGYQVVDENHGLLGKVEEIYEMPGQDLISVLYNAQEILIPINEDIVLAPVHEDKILKVKLPEGLLELYIHPNNDQPDDED